jgi:AcrR family transcriptional regulator
MVRAAIDIFFAQGYRASMASIAAKANVARQTVYSHFGSKERLFESVVRSLAGSVTVTLAQSGVELRESLINFAAALRERVLAPRSIGVYRTLVAEAPRFPKIARLVYAQGQEAAQRALADFLAEHMRAGALRKGDAQFAAQMFMNMAFGHERARLLYGVRAQAPGDRERIERIVDCFLRAFAPEEP